MLRLLLLLLLLPSSGPAWARSGLAPCTLWARSGCVGGDRPLTVGDNTKKRGIADTTRWVDQTLPSPTRPCPTPQTLPDEQWMFGRGRRVGSGTVESYRAIYPHLESGRWQGTTAIGTTAIGTTANGSAALGDAALGPSAVGSFGKWKAPGSTNWKAPGGVSRGGILWVSRGYIG